MQYPSKNLFDDEMSYIEFQTLMNGVMPETPLGNLVTIRSEENKDMLKNFTEEQHRIRNEWRAMVASERNASISEEDKKKAVEDIQEALMKAFS